MATIGLDKLYYAPITEDENGEETYGTPVQLAKAMSADLTVEIAEATLYADDGAAEIVKEFKSGTLSLGVDDIGASAAAALTGCKNIANAVKTGPNEVFVPVWNVRLITEVPVRDGLQAVGIRAHGFKPDEPLNRFPVRILQAMEEPFAWVSEFRYADQSPDTPALWWRYGKQQRPAVLPKALGVAPEDVLLLY